MTHRHGGASRALNIKIITAVFGCALAGGAHGQARDAVELAPVKVQGKLYGSRETNSLGDSAASVGIATADDIRHGQIRSFRDAFRRFGNIGDAAYTDSGFVIRGISSEGFVPSGNPVASLYVDSVLQSRDSTRRGARGLWDVEQVEVYRGPQSTLSGRAAMGGAIYIKSRDPVFLREAEVSLTGGSNRLANTAAMVNTPLGDQLAMRIAGEFEQRDAPVNYPGYQHYRRIGDLEREQYYNLRGKLLFTPDALASTVALLSYSFSYDRPNTRDIFAGPGFGLRARRGDYPLPNWVEVREQRTRNLGLEVTHDFSPGIRLTALTGYHRGVLGRPSVNEGTPGERHATVAGQQKNSIITQELRLNGEAQQLRWVAGLYASRDNFNSWRDRPSMVRIDRNRDGQRITNLAMFGEATWAFQPGWKMTLGGRLDRAQTRAWGLTTRSRPPTAAPTTISDYRGVKFSETNFLPKVGLSRDFSERHAAGVTWSRGFRAGHWGLNSSTWQHYFYEPERADSYELYYKGRLLDDRLYLSANVFHTRYTDQQVEMRLDPANPLYREITNAASSRTWGAELEGRWRASSMLSTFMSLGYLNTRFLEFRHFQYGDLTGKAFPDAPAWTLALGGQYNFGNGYYVGGDAKYVSTRLARFGVPPQETLSAYAVVNLQAGYRAKNWEAIAFVENLFDKVYYLAMDQVGNMTYAAPGDGRCVGVNVRLKF